METCAAFPKGAHDDDVDALTQLLVRWNAPMPAAGFLQFAREETARMRAESRPGRSADIWPSDEGVDDWA